MSHRFDAAYPNLKGCIFVVTYGRSGSTLLQNLLMTIEGTTIRGENHNAMECIWGAARRVRMTRYSWGEEPRGPEHPWHGADQMRPVKFGAALVDAFVENVLTPPNDARWFGFKEIRYNALGDDFPMVLDFMHHHFKNARFIFNTRDVDEVVRSGWWKDWARDDVVRLVEGMDARFADYAAQYPERAMITNYASFCDDPAGIEPVFDWLGEPIDTAKTAAVLARRLDH